MKEINENMAIQQLNMGLFPKCKVSREVYHYIHTVSELGNHKKLSSCQQFVLLGYTDKEISDFCLSDSEIQISIDEATDMIVAGNPVYGRLIEEYEVKLSSLRELVDFYKRATTLGETFHLYWKE